MIALRLPHNGNVDRVYPFPGVFCSRATAPAAWQSSCAGRAWSWPLACQLIAARSS